MLEGYRLLDLSSRLPGPLCSQILVDLGMEVIRIEPPEYLGKGDLFREIPETSAPYFPMLNRGKKSVTLNLKLPKGRALFYEMVKGADVVLEGFRPGVTRRLGIDWEKLRTVNPRLVMVSISGYGHRGPYKEQAGHDLNYLAYSGILGLNAPSEEELPVLPPVQIADIGGGTFPAVVGILAALIEREKTQMGQWLDVSMLNGSLFWMAMALFDWGIGKPVAPGVPPIARGAVNFNVFETKDGKYLALGALERNFWETFCEALGRPEWKTMYGDEQMMRSAVLIKELREIFRTRTREEWLALFRGWDVCLSPVYSLEEVEEDPHIKAQGVLHWVSLEKGKRFPVIPFPIRQSKGKQEKAPDLGEHTVSFFREVLGLSEEDVAALRREGVI